MQAVGAKISDMDILFLKAIRKNISEFMNICSIRYDNHGLLLLDIAPQDHEGAAPYFKKSKIMTLDINPKANATFIADICETNNKIIDDQVFDMVVCTEVLEHTLNPFNAVDEIYRILKPGGYLFISVPFNFRIHGPLPDCWRFTEYGLKTLLRRFIILEFNQLEDKDRYLMPIHYTVIAQK